MRRGEAELLQAIELAVDSGLFPDRILERIWELSEKEWSESGDFVGLCPIPQRYAEAIVMTLRDVGTLAAVNRLSILIELLNERQEYFDGQNQE